MWDRKKLKQIAKEKFQANYWKCVLVGLLFGLITGGVSGGYSGGGASFGNAFNNVGSYDDDDDDDFSYDELFGEEDDAVKAAYESEIGKDVKKSMDAAEDSYERADDFLDDIRNMDPVAKAAFVVVIVLIVSIILLIAIAIGILVDVFLLNPLEIGCAKFFYKNLQEPANVSNIAYGFDHSYKNGVKIMLWRDVYLFLWSLLLIIPGIIKGYEYKMIPYLLSEYPDMTKEEAFAESKRMMDGQKWKAFVLDFSFIGWDVLSGLFTAGLLSIFFVIPYKRSAQAALYDALKYGHSTNSQSEIAPM